MKIQNDISKTIKNRSWLSIEYQNQKDGVTNYWTIIKDKNINNRSFTATAFTMAKV